MHVMTNDQPNAVPVDLAELFPDDGRPDILVLRNIDTTPADPVAGWGSEGLRAAVGRGVAVHWRRIAEAILAEPFGPVAEVIETDTMWTSEFFGQNGISDPDSFHVIDALLRVIDLARAECAVPELTPEMSGVWSVHTIGTVHVWNLNAWTYERSSGTGITRRRIRARRGAAADHASRHLAAHT